MATITDVEKLRPELLNMSVAELERRRTEIDMAIAKKHAEEEAARRAALVDEATGKVDAVVSGLRWLHDNGFLSAKVTEAFSRGDGQFNPAIYVRAPRSIEEVLRTPRKEGVRRRRRRDPETGELVPSKRARAAGEV